MSGKTTLVKALVEVHPYPKPLSIRENGDGRPTEILPEALGGTTGVKPLPIGLVVATSYREGARWRPRQLLPGRAVMALLAHTVSVRRKPERALTALRQVVADASVIKGRVVRLRKPLKTSWAVNGTGGPRFVRG